MAVLRWFLFIFVGYPVQIIVYREVAAGYGWGFQSAGGLHFKSGGEAYKWFYGGGG
jgi:hypothetical protein